jgi:FO synthase
MNKNISFLRIRPCDSDNEIYLSSRKKEGTTSFLIKENSNLNLTNLYKLNFQTLSHDFQIDADVWLFSDNDIQKIKDMNPSRLMYKFSKNIEIALEVIDRVNPKIVLVQNSDDAETISKLSTSNKFIISAYADNKEQVIDLLNSNVEDILLRDWSSEQIKELQELNGYSFFERTLLSPIIPLDEARSIFDKLRFYRYLQTRDVRGYKREETGWAPGSGKELPKLNNFNSNQLSNFKNINFDKILNNVDKGEAINDVELRSLFSTQGQGVNEIAALANELNFKINGNTVTFVKNRNINYTNQCYFKCGFCGFSKGPKSFDLKEKPYSIDIPEVVQRTIEASETGATEVCLQGGINPDYTGEFYLSMVQEIKKVLPEMHIHGFTPLEIWQGAQTINKSVEEYLIMLKEAGLNTLPGTAAEILDDRIRKFLCPDKITSAQWAYVMEVAHTLGIRSTATIMFGHIDDADSWVNHFSLIRTLQRKTKGFTEVVPLPFVHMGSPIFVQGKSMPGPTWDEVVLIHSLARIYFYNEINNIQASWVKLGHDGAAKLLHAGVNDLGGTLINENISRASGADHGQETTPNQFIEIIKNENKIPKVRNTLYTDFKEIDDTLISK